MKNTDFENSFIMWNLSNACWSVDDRYGQHSTKISYKYDISL